MTLVSDYLAAQTASLSREVASRTDPLGYGRDLSLDDDLEADMRTVDGVTLLAEACFRRLTTPRGGVPDDPDYGKDLRAYLNEPATRTQLRALEGEIAVELAKDDRIADGGVAATAAVSSNGRTISASIVVTPVDQTLGRFSLVVVLDATTLDVTLAAIQKGTP